ncbi:hypothetical protein EFN19_04720 [Propionibacterium freudenreichii]|nr:hypothetical protein [Propionibacterium freudenreichii]
MDALQDVVERRRGGISLGVEHSADNLAEPTGVVASQQPAQRRPSATSIAHHVDEFADRGLVCGISPLLYSLQISNRFVRMSQTGTDVELS